MNKKFPTFYSLLAVIFIVPLIHSKFANAQTPSSVPLRGPIKLESFLSRPKLTLVLVIDQFRADYLTRFASRFLPSSGKNGEVGGFKYLMSKGAYFPQAKYDVLENMTCPGHATILTGSYPYLSGIVLNEWYDRSLGRMIYCVDDGDSPLVGSDLKGAESGVSPKNLVGTTVGDELKNSGRPSKIISIALKDRAAILLGGHRADLAVWLSSNYRWVSSRYYVKDKELPRWIETLNKELASKEGSAYAWISEDSETGLSEPSGKEKFARKAKTGSLESTRFALGNDITTDAAIAALKAEKLGQTASTDMLEISFSSHDLLGHQVGPNSRDMEEMTISEDRAISKILNVIKKSVPGGLQNVVIAFTADHGIAPLVPYAKAAKIDADYIDTHKLQNDLEIGLSKKFTEPKDGKKWIVALQSFNIYLNDSVIQEKRVNQEMVENEIKRMVNLRPGVYTSFSKSDFNLNRLPAGMFERLIKKSYSVKTSGDVVLIPKPFYMESGPPVTHMTGYSYDRTVPLIVAGAKLRPGVYASSAEVVDLAPTLSFILGILPPAQSEGRVLSEALY